MELLTHAILRRGASLLLLLAMAGVVGAAAVAGPRSEYAVKAEFLVNFASLVDWPAEALRDDEVLRVGILGDEAVVDEIRSRLDGRKVRSRVVRAERLGPLDQARRIHLIYVTASADSEVEAVLRALAGASVLLVGESEGFARRGGVINFYNERSRIRFEVNPRAAREAGLRVSSRLLSIARVVD